MRLFILDVNGTLIDHNTPLDYNFEEWLNNFFSKNKVILTSGASFKSVKKKIRSLTENCYFVSVLSDNERYQQDQLVYKQSNGWPPELIDRLTADFPSNPIFVGESAITINSSPGERYFIADHINEEYDGYNAVLCNSGIAVDLLNNRYDKSQMVKDLDDELIFITDRPEYLGYDHTLATAVNEVGGLVIKTYGWKNTWEILDKYTHEEDNHSRAQ